MRKRINLEYRRREIKASGSYTHYRKQFHMFLALTLILLLCLTMAFPYLAGTDKNSVPRLEPAAEQAKDGQAGEDAGARTADGPSAEETENSDSAGESSIDKLVESQTPSEGSALSDAESSDLESSDTESSDMEEDEEKEDELTTAVRPVSGLQSGDQERNTKLLQFAGLPETSVSTYLEFKQALQSGAQVIVLEKSISAAEVGGLNSYPMAANNTAVIGGTTASAAISQDVEICGRTGTETLDMDMYYILLGGAAPTLYVHDLKITTTSAYTNDAVSTPYACGVFQAVNALSAKWSGYFYNVTYEGSCLIGSNTYTATGVNAYFTHAEFWGETIITVNNYAAMAGVVCAQNITLDGAFTMYDAIDKTAAVPLVYRQASLQVFFKSPNVSNTAISQTMEKVAYGNFLVKPGGTVHMRRNSATSGQGTVLPGSEYYRSLIDGYANFYFYEGCTFDAAAGTNRYIAIGDYYPNSGGSSTYLPQYRSAVIYSGNCNNFIVGYVPQGETTQNKTTSVTLSTLPASGSAGYADFNGWTALFLAKQRGSATDTGDKNNPVLNITVAQYATLNVRAENAVDNSFLAATHGCAPVYIAGPGSSRTTIEGSLKVFSGGGDGWSYQFNVAAQMGYQDFYVTSTGNVHILANNLHGQQGIAEYAAFDAYGYFETNIRVDKGGVMHVDSRGYRGISLAGSGLITYAYNYVPKTVYVEGKLDVTGWSWAITAEATARLYITAANGGKINLRSNADDKTTTGPIIDASSTVYSVGTVNYEATGSGEIYLFHNGGTYSAIYHDSYGPLQIDIDTGGKMTVYSLNSMPPGQTAAVQATNYRARRSAICAQSTVSSGGYYASNNNYIRVDGVGSSLYVNNRNPQVHAGAGEHYFPMSAISFNNASASPADYSSKTASAGRIDVSNGASFEAINESKSPTINIHNGTITFDNPGYFHIRNNALADYPEIMPDYTLQGNGPKSGHAIYNHGTMDTSLAGKTHPQEGLAYGPSNVLAVNFVNCDVSVWSTYENASGYAMVDMDNSWKNVSFTATNTLGTYVHPMGTNGQPASGTGGSGTVYNGYTLALDEFHLSSYGRIGGKGSSYDVNFNKLDEADSPLAGAKFVIWGYVQRYVDSVFDENTGQFIPGYYEDTAEKEYFYYDQAANTSMWIPEAAVSPDYSNVSIITTTTDTPYNGRLPASVYGGLSFGRIYFLQEVEAPPGYDLLTHSFAFAITSQADKDAGSNSVELTINNYPVTIPDPLGSIQIIKYGDKDDDALTDAKFAIEQQVNEAAGTWTYIHYDTALQEWLPTTNSDSATLVTMGAAGLTFDLLPAGVYRITEVAPPDSSTGETYMLLKEPIVVAVPYAITYPAGSSETPQPGYNDNETAVNPDGSTTYYYYNLTFTVTDTMGVKMPETGFFGGIFPLIAGGALLVACSLFLLGKQLIKIKKKNKKYM